MSKKWILFVILTLFVLAALGSAETGDKKFAIRARYGFAKYQESEYTNGGCPEFDLAFRLSTKFELGAGFGYYLTKSGGNWLSPGNLYQMPIDLFLHVVPVPDGKISPYFGGGASYTIFNHQMEAQQALADVGFEATETVENSIGYFAGGGADIFFSPKMGINVDVKYRIINAKATATITDTVSHVTVSDSETLKLNGIIFGFGITILF
jgi:outer membrane protein W